MASINTTKPVSEQTTPGSEHAPRKRLSAAVAALRPHQWIKNILLFVPLLAAHVWGDLNKVLAAVIAAVAFCACSSAIYLLNDLLDIEADRLHPAKARRAFAAGHLSVPYGLALACGLLVLALTLSATLLPRPFVLTLVVYIVLNALYSTWLKRKVMIDVLLLAGLYVLRLLAGGAANGIPISEWLIALSLFLFTSLAFAKRYAELARVANEGGQTASGRGYRVSDLSMIENQGTTSGYLAVLVLALYLNSGQVRELYRLPSALWLCCPLLMYWINRLWFVARRGELTEDPIVFAFTDRVSLMLALIVAALGAIATYGVPF